MGNTTNKLDWIRIGNDFVLDWILTRDDLPENFTGLDVGIEVKGEYGNDLPCAWNIEGNVVKMAFFGKDQKRCGFYTLTIKENYGKPNMATVDVVKAFKLVEHSWMEKDGSCSNISIKKITLNSELHSSKAGLDNYQLACLEGFKGTRKEYLKSLIGPKGDPGTDGKDGMPIYPTYEVNTRMHLIMDSDSTSNRIKVENNGHLTFDF